MVTTAAGVNSARPPGRGNVPSNNLSRPATFLAELVDLASAHLAKSGPPTSLAEVIDRIEIRDARVIVTWRVQPSELRKVAVALAAYQLGHRPGRIEHRAAARGSA